MEWESSLQDRVSNIIRNRNTESQSKDTDMDSLNTTEGEQVTSSTCLTNREADNSIVLIPDKPSPLFSRFVGKKSVSQRRQDNDQYRHEDETDQHGTIRQSQNGLKYSQSDTIRQSQNGLKSSFQFRIPDATISDGDTFIFKKNPHPKQKQNKYFDTPVSNSGYNKSSSVPSCSSSVSDTACQNVNTYEPHDNHTFSGRKDHLQHPDRKNFTSSYRKIPKKSLMETLADEDTPSSSNLSVGRPSQEEARVIALEKIKKAVKRRKASEKRYFQDVLSCEDTISPSYSAAIEPCNTDNASPCNCDSEKMRISLTSNAVKDKSHLYQQRGAKYNVNDVDNDTGNLNHSQDGDTVYESERHTGNRTPNLSQHSPENSINSKEQKKVKLNDGSVHRMEHKKHDPKVVSRKFSMLCWPSESESDTDSDNSDTIPLREILNSNKSEKDYASSENKRSTPELLKVDSECSLKKHAGIKNIVTASLVGNISDIKEENTGVSKLDSKSDSNPSQGKGEKVDITKVQKSRGQRSGVQRSGSVISISSDEELDGHISNSELERLLSDDYLPTPPGPPQLDTTYTTHRGPSSQSQENYLNFRVVRPTIDSVDSPADIVTCSDVNTMSDPTDQLLLQSSQVSSSANINHIRNRARVSGLKRPRSSSNSVKGRAIRSRPGRHVGVDQVVSPDRSRVLAGAVGFTPVSSLPRHHNRRDSDPVTMVQQLENDEEYARKLQEQMDLEFAMSLHNMENTPPPQAYHPAPHDVHWGGMPDPTTHHHHHPPGQQGRHIHVPRARHNPRRADLEDLSELEDILGSTDESVPFDQMMPVTSPPPRTRTRAQRRSRSHQRTQNYLNAIDLMEAHITSLLGEATSFPMPRGRQRGRRGNYFPNVAMFNSPAGAGNDYERRVGRYIGRFEQDFHQELDLLNLAEMLGDVKERGLSQAQASRLPERKFQSQNDPNDLEECMICMCEYVAGDNLRILPCFHEFHAPCIDKWINGNATCPICRVEVRI